MTLPAGTERVESLKASSEGFPAVTMTVVGLGAASFPATAGAAWKASRAVRAPTLPQRASAGTTKRDLILGIRTCTSVDRWLRGRGRKNRGRSASESDGGDGPLCYEQASSGRSRGV